MGKIISIETFIKFKLQNYKLDSDGTLLMEVRGMTTMYVWKPVPIERRNLNVDFISEVKEYKFCEGAIGSEIITSDRNSCLSLIPVQELLKLLDSK